MTAPPDDPARRASAEPVLLGSRLDAYQQAHGLTEESLALRLGCTPEALSRLRLCAVPRPDDMHRVAAYCGCDPDRLGEVLAYGEPKP